MDAAREEIMQRARAASGRPANAPAPPPPPTGRVRPRAPGDREAEIEQLLAEIDKLAGVTRRIADPQGLDAALDELVRAETVWKATFWDTPEIRGWDVSGRLRALGVEIVSPQADSRQVAECDLGATGVDIALAETGTLLLRSSPEKLRVVSLLPRVHLALLRPAVLRPDLHQAFAEVKGDGYCVMVTGPSRTADIELTLTLGVHGPKTLYVWVLE